jgi:hypothetical protein
MSLAIFYGVRSLNCLQRPKNIFKVVELHLVFIQICNTSKNGIIVSPMPVYWTNITTGPVCYDNNLKTLISVGNRNKICAKSGPQEIRELFLSSVVLHVTYRE